MLVDVLLQNLHSDGERYILRSNILIWVFDHDTMSVFLYFCVFVFWYYISVLHQRINQPFAFQARESGIGGAGEGLFAKKALKQVL